MKIHSFLMAVSVSLAGALAVPPVGAEERNDPTRPPAAAAPTTAAAVPDRGAAPLDLSAVFFADGRRIAIIDGKRVHERDRIGDTEVLEISPGGVHLLREGKIVRIDLVDSQPKHPRQGDAPPSDATRTEVPLRFEDPLPFKVVGARE